MNNPLKVPCIILSAVSIVSLSAAAALAVSNSRLKNAAEEAPAEVMVIAPAEECVPTETAPLMTEAIMSEAEPQNTVYIYDNGIDLIEFPEIEGAVMNAYDMSMLKTDEKKHKYLSSAEGEIISRFGIDVSSHQMKIDWEKAAADGVEFAMLRCGYRGYETGGINEDKYFRRNAQGAVAAGIDIGAYFYSQALTEEEAEEEARFVLDLLAETGTALQLPIVFDWEFPTDEDPARTDNMSGEMQQKCCEAFCRVIREAGYEPMYYATVSTAIFRYDMGALADTPLWLAEYYAETDFPYSYRMWQYSCSGVVDGIEGLVDLNILIDN